MSEDIHKGITSNIDLIIEYGNNRRRSLDDHMMMDTSEIGFKISKKRKKLMPHPLK
jgi:hypothetical protein